MNASWSLILLIAAGLAAGLFLTRKGRASLRTVPARVRARRRRARASERRDW